MSEQLDRLRAEVEARGTPAERLATIAREALAAAGHDRRYLHLAYAIARAPGLDAAVAEILAQTDEGLVLGALVGNPRTPLEIVRRFAARHLWRLAHNPRLPELLREEPTLLAVGAAVQLASQCERGEVLAALAEHAEAAVRRAVIGNPRCPPTLVAALARDADREAAAAAREHPAAPVEVVFSEEDSAAVTIAEASRRATGVQGRQALACLLRLLARTQLTAEELREVEAVRQLLARHHPGLELRGLAGALVEQGDTPVDVLAALAGVLGARVLEHDSAQRSPEALVERLPAQIAAELARVAEPGWLAAFAGHADADVRGVVVGRPDCRPELLQTLVSDAAADVVMAALRHPRCSPGSLANVLRSPNSELRAWYAGSQPLTPSQCEALADDLAAVVRRALARREGLSELTLVRMCSDPDLRVREQLAARPDLPEAGMPQLARSPEPSVRRRLAAHARATAKALDLLARDPDTTVRAAAAAHPSTSPDALARLAGDGAAAVRRALLARRELPAQAWAKLLAQERELIAELLQHPGLPSDALLDLLAREDRHDVVRVFRSPRLDREARRSILAAVDPAAELGDLSWLYVRGGRLRRLALLHPRCPPEMLASLVGDPSAELRAIVAGNPATPAAAVTVLRDDPEPRVRDVARDRLACQQMIAELERGAHPELVDRLIGLLFGQPGWHRDPWRRALAQALERRAPPGTRERLADARSGRADPRGVMHVCVALDGWSRIREECDREDRREAEHDFSRLVERCFRGAERLEYTGDGITASLRDAAAGLAALRSFGTGLGWSLHARAGAHVAPRGADPTDAAALTRDLCHHGHDGLLVIDAGTAAHLRGLATPEPCFPLHRAGWAEAVATYALTLGRG